MPFRQSKLTYLLKDSIGGNARMMVIANIWPELSHIEETISTLRFVSRLSKLTNCPRKNIHLDQSLLLKKYEREIKDLKMELTMHDILVGRGRILYEPYTPEQQYEQQKLAHKFLSNEVEDLDFESIRQVKELFFQFRNLYRNLSVESKRNNDNLSEDKLRKILSRKSLDEIKNKVDRKNQIGQEEYDNGFGIGTAPLDAGMKLGRDQEFHFGKSREAAQGKENLMTKEDPKKKIERKLANLNSKEFNEDEVYVDGRLDKNALFHNYKENAGIYIVNDINSILEEIKSARAKFEAEKLECEVLKSKIDELKEAIKTSEENGIEDITHDHVVPKHSLKMCKANYKQHYDNYAYYKKHLKELEKQLWNKKRELIEGFNASLKKNFSINLDYFDRQDRTKQESRNEMAMSNEEQLFDKTRQKFETMMKAKKQEKLKQR